jgi:hypothetical protein
MAVIPAFSGLWKILWNAGKLPGVDQEVISD